ncbi:MAG: hypothetical protein J6M17_10840 [Ruminococcus sp.]|nr:hypothetical protein [Ruminococcus sp.]
MPAFGKKVREESINDKMVRLFKEGMSVADISNMLDVKQDVITNVIRRRCGEDSIPDTVIRSKNAVPHNEEVPMKADAPSVEAVAENVLQPEAQADGSSEGLSKLERFMFEKEKKRQEEADKAFDEITEEAENDTTGQMEGISLDGIDLDSLGSAADITAAADSSAISDEAAAVAEEMAGILSPEISADTEIEEAPISSFESDETDAVIEELSVDEPVADESPAVEFVTEEEPAPVIEDIAEEQPGDDTPAPSFDIPAGAHSGSAFDKMKAFAQMQIAANNEKLAELEAQLGSAEGDYGSQLEAAEKEVEEAKVAYEDVITKGESISDRRDELQTEHRAALARAEEDYRKKLEEIEQNYNDAIAHANQTYADKENELNNEADTIDAEKENAKNNFLTKQSVVVELKEKIENEIEPIKKQIASLKEENKGYESFMN